MKQILPRKKEGSSYLVLQDLPRTGCYTRKEKKKPGFRNGQDFKAASLQGSVLRTPSGPLVCTCNPRLLWESEAGGLRVLPAQNVPALFDSRLSSVFLLVKMVSPVHMSWQCIFSAISDLDILGISMLLSCSEGWHIRMRDQCGGCLLHLCLSQTSSDFAFLEWSRCLWGLVGGCECLITEEFLSLGSHQGRREHLLVLQ